MVSRLELPQPSYRPIKTLQLFYEIRFALSFCIENFNMHNYARFLQIESHLWVHYSNRIVRIYQVITLIVSHKINCSL